VYIVRLSQYPPYELPPPPSVEIAQHLVSRMGGSTDPEVQYRGITTLHERTVALADAATVYIAESDSPVLVAYAVAHPGEDDALLHQYIAIHAGNPYADYRNRSLWGILSAALCHPNDYAARDYARLLVTAALAATLVRFREGLRVTVVGLRARARASPARFNSWRFSSSERARQRLRLSRSAGCPTHGGTTPGVSPPSPRCTGMRSAAHARPRAARSGSRAPVRIRRLPGAVEPDARRGEPDQAAA